MFTLRERIEMAKASTKAVAELKDYKVRNNINREWREIARNMVANNGGYQIRLYGGIGVNGPYSRGVYGLRYNSVWKSIYFVKF